ncbi:ABC-type multidrug transport system permease component [Vibrio variabilis]|nr:ABC-type multidrug transport system permease component [Vibrio variabilis]
MKSLTRMSAIMVKEIRQLSRDRITFGMVIMIPLIQLILFGFA